MQSTLFIANFKRRVSDSNAFVTFFKNMVGLASKRKTYSLRYLLPAHLSNQYGVPKPEVRKFDDRTRISTGVWLTTWPEDIVRIKLQRLRRRPKRQRHSDTIDRMQVEQIDGQLRNQPNHVR